MNGSRPEGGDDGTRVPAPEGWSPAPPDRLETARLVLRQPDEGDVGALVRGLGRREVSMMMLTPPHPYTEADARAWLAERLDARRAGTAFGWALIAKEPGEGLDAFVGTSGLSVEVEHACAELGYWVAPERAGRGYASEAAWEIVRVGFEVMGLHRIHAGWYSENPASGRVLEKLGFAPEGCRRDHYLRMGRRVNVMLVGMLRSEWMARRRGASAGGRA